MSQGLWAACLAMALLYFLFMYLPVSTQAPDRPDSPGAYRKTREIQNIIDYYYLGEYQEELLTDYMYLGLVTGLGDPYSAYYTEEQYEELRKSQEGSYTGWGSPFRRRRRTKVSMWWSVWRILRRRRPAYFREM